MIRKECLAFEECVHYEGIPLRSIYGIFTDIHCKFKPNVDRYSILWSIWDMNYCWHQDLKIQRSRIPPHKTIGLVYNGNTWDDFENFHIGSDSLKLKKLLSDDPLKFQRWWSVGFYHYVLGRWNNKLKTHENTSCCEGRFRTDNERESPAGFAIPCPMFFFWRGMDFLLLYLFSLCAAAIIKIQLKPVCLTIYKPSLPCNYSCTLDKGGETSGWKKTVRIIQCRSNTSKFLSNQ